MFEIASNPTIRLSDIRHRRFGLIDRELDGLPFHVRRILDSLIAAKARPEFHGPVYRPSRYQRLVA